MSSVKTAPITFDPDEAAGLRYYVELRLGSVGEEFDSAEDQRAHLGYIGELLDLRDVLAGSDPVTYAQPSDLLMHLIEEGGRFAPELISDGLSPRSSQPHEDVRRGKGLMRLAHRLGLYDGVLV